MINQKLPPDVMAYAEALIEATRLATPELSKRGINYDHFQIKSLLENHALYRVLTEIRDELRFSNQSKRMEMFPQSMMNPNRTE